LAKEAELARADALARQASVAEEAYVWLKKKTAPTKEEAAASLKKPPVYPTAAVASATPSDDGDGDGDGDGEGEGEGEGEGDGRSSALQARQNKKKKKRRDIPLLSLPPS
jgi:hypothetical protein